MTTIKLKNGSGAPTAGDLAQGEPALDLTNKRLYTEDSGGTVIEVGTNPGTDVTFADNRKAIFGAGSDLQIYHDGSNSYIENTAPFMLIESGTIVLRNTAGTEDYAKFNENSDVKLYFDNAQKFATTSTGIDVTGSVVSDGLTVEGSSTGAFNAATFYNSDTTVNSGVDLTFNCGSSGTATAKIKAIRSFAGYSDLAFQTEDNDNLRTRLLIDSTGDISFYEDTGTTAKFFWDASAERLGLGTSSPARPLSVHSTSINPNIKLTRDGTSESLELGSFYITSNSNDLQLATSGSNDITLLTNNTERMRVTSAGQTQVVGYDAMTLGFPAVAGGASRSGIKPTVTGAGDGQLQFLVGGNNVTEATTVGAMIDASGNLLVGVTSAQDFTSTTTNGHTLYGGTANVALHSRSGANALAVQRTTNDGALVNFFKDTTSVGSIGSISSRLKVVSATTQGYYFLNNQTANSSNQLWINGTLGAWDDASYDIGLSTQRWKDLYLSGGVYLGGTGSANKLDDYEEGTFTPTYANGITSPAYVVQNGSYVKIGKLVTYQIRLEASSGTANSGQLRIGGLPFTSTSASSYGGAFFNYSQGFITDIGARTMHMGANGTEISFYKTDGNGLAGTEVDNITGTILINGQYEVA